MDFSFYNEIVKCFGRHAYIFAHACAAKHTYRYQQNICGRSHGTWTEILRVLMADRSGLDQF